MAVAPGLRVGKYEVLRKLGQGGFGILYVARDTELDRHVAIKFLRPEHLTRPDVVQRFLQEARSAAKISHPGIVTVFECGQVTETSTRADGTVFIAMELLHGESLAGRLKREKQLAPELAVSICRQLAAALAAAHRAGIVHRDLKPDNIFLVPDPAVRGGERVKILDFGVAKLADGQLSGGVRTHSAMVLGTPMYMSPEQCKSSARVDHRSDIYAVGCILFELLCGRTPYDGDAGELIAKHQLAPVPRPRDVSPALPAKLDTLVTTMLAKTPDERPPSMDAVDDALAAIEGSPVEDTAVSRIAPPAPSELATTVAHRARSSRRVVWFAAGAIVLAGVGVGLAVRSMSRRDETPRMPTAAAPVLVDGGTTTPNVVDAAPPTPVATAASTTPLECAKLQADERWREVVECAAGLDDTAAADAFHTKGTMEMKAAFQAKNVQDAIARSDVGSARASLARIPTDSVARIPSERAFEQAFGEETAKRPPGKAWEQRSKPAADPAPELAIEIECDAEKLRRKGDDHLQTGMDAAALAAFEASLRCKGDASVMQKAFMAACRSKNQGKAKLYFAKLPPSKQPTLGQICERAGIKVP